MDVWGSLSNHIGNIIKETAIFLDFLLTTSSRKQAAFFDFLFLPFYYTQSEGAAVF